MKLLKNLLKGIREEHWTLLEAFAYFLKGVTRELKIFPIFFDTFWIKVHRHARAFKKKWLKRDGKLTYFDFNGAKLPDTGGRNFAILLGVFEDTFLVSCFHQDNYDKSVVLPLDKIMGEGPYGYVDGTFDVTVKKGDVVIDAGAWIGDFSAYAASKGAIAYAFEPVEETYRWLCKTRDLNTAGQIHPVKKGLGSSECEMDISIGYGSSNSSSVVLNIEGITEKIAITTLDKFAEENKLTRVDFIKSDIEGAERDMLRGATKVLQKFAPKLAICTYHLPDDPEVLEKIILDANPKYRVVHLRHKLMAAVIR
ncbi:hypothetical protein AGMMS49965_11200 [Bacteroidia bacterium]|nr:hypothetical protein AGMMS49965_11200 [Bacteroidia bacterium]